MEEKALHKQTNPALLPARGNVNSYGKEFFWEDL